MIPWTAAHQVSLSITNSQSLLKLMSIESVMPSNHLILCCPLLLLLPSIFLSIRIFSSKSVLHIRWPKYWSFSISSSNEYSGLISFRIDSFHLLAVQGTLKSFLQHHSSKASILWRSAFFIVQLSHPSSLLLWICVCIRINYFCSLLSLSSNIDILITTHLTLHYLRYRTSRRVDITHRLCILVCTKGKHTFYCTQDCCIT